jgi:hypothetical protein
MLLNRQYPPQQFIVTSYLCPYARILPGRLFTVLCYGHIPRQHSCSQSTFVDNAHGTWLGPGVERCLGTLLRIGQPRLHKLLYIRTKRRSSVDPSSTSSVALSEMCNIDVGMKSSPLIFGLLPQTWTGIKSAQREVKGMFVGPRILTTL